MTTNEIEQLSTDELIASINDLVNEGGDTREARLEAARAYRAAVSNLEIQWQQWLHAQYLPEESAKVHSKVFNLAWSENHGDGWGSVESLYIDLAELIKSVRADW
jgi:hypothetical protein